MRLEQHLAKTIAGLANASLNVYSLGIHINILCGRPARALAAHD
jgi:hypothetical protein